ncbi:MAG: ATP-binding cassette domain-containing protein, partial [Gammaproteobacteria bacterium]|nr:ATP-binding cassette domain-containing protein [Gammaproteobacteria bacterium]
MTHLAAEDLVKRYRGRAVVNGVSLHLNQGEVLGLLGPNGAGKTTTFYMMAGLIPVDQGRVTLGEHDITDKPMHARARLGLGYLAQEPSIFRRLTVAQNVIAILETRADLDRAQHNTQCDQLLHEFGIRHLRDNMAISLSGGERRRLEIARLRYMGFEHRGSVRIYRFERLIPGEEKGTFTVDADLAMFAKYHVGIQEGPALCLRLLVAELDVAGAAAQRSFQCSLTDREMLAHLASRPVP